MANKKRQEENRQTSQNKIKNQKYEAATKSLPIFPIIALAVSVLVLVLFFVTFADVYNQGTVEVKVSGWSFVIAGLTGNYTSPNKVYGDMAMPFYAFAKEWVETVSVVALIAMLVLVATIVMQVVTLVTKSHMLNSVSAVLSVVAAVLLIICYAECLDMKNAKIISDYCRNPVCVIRSVAIFPAIVSLLSGAVSAFATAKYMKAQKILK